MDDGSEEPGDQADDEEDDDDEDDDYEEDEEEEEEEEEEDGSWIRRQRRRRRPQPSAESQFGSKQNVKELPEATSETEAKTEEAPKAEPEPPSLIGPSYLSWSPEEVAEWIENLGFPQYKECFTSNFISGRKLIHVNCSNLPQMGITDFEHMKEVSYHVRELLEIEEPLFIRSIALPRRDNMGLFLEQKSRTGKRSDVLTYSQFIEDQGLCEYEPQTLPPVTENIERESVQLEYQPEGSQHENVHQTSSHSSR